MRHLILIALCVALASANIFTKQRFLQLLNQQQNQYNQYNNWANNWAENDYTNGYEIDELTNCFGGNCYGANCLGGNCLGGNCVGGNCQNENCYDDEFGCQGPFGNNQCYNNQDEDDYNNAINNALNNPFNNPLNNPFNNPLNNPFNNPINNAINNAINNNNNCPGGSCYNWEQDLNQAQAGPLREVQQANTKLASRLYRQTKEEKDDKNTVSSPLSVQMALAALNQGARGNTKRQIARAIAGGLQQQERQQVFQALAQQYKQLNNALNPNTKINPVTAVVISANTPTQQNFIQQVIGNTRAQVKKCNFQQQPQQCRNMINNWMAQRTNAKINHIVPRDAVTTNTKMVLVNGLEMKAAWGQQMRQHITRQAKFYPLNQPQVKVVQVMETQGRFKYYENELVKVVGIPTQQQQLTLYTIVPKEKDGLTQVEKAHLQDGNQLQQLLQQTDRHISTVGVQLPKFQVKQKIDVRRSLKKQGVQDAFDPQHANFAGITGISNNQQAELEDNLGQLNGLGWNAQNDMDSPYGNVLANQLSGLDAGKVHLNKFIHQATIKVTENGITAATDYSSIYDYEQQQYNNGILGGIAGLNQMDAIDQINGVLGQQSYGQKVVKANRAFAFAVKHNPTNQVVLVGRVVDATQKQVTNSQQTINGVDQL